tara:strand:+ start:26 stop:187 length:162 start_codon:yes stop_codon:yes gene_type:complete
LEEIMKKYILVLILISILVSCGGSSNSTPTSTSTPVITGLQGDINAIEPIDLD